MWGNSTAYDLIKLGRERLVFPSQVRSGNTNLIAGRIHYIMNGPAALTFIQTGRVGAV